MALLGSMAQERQIESADLLAVLYAYSPLKTVRKEGMRAYRALMYAESGENRQALKLLGEAEKLDPESALVPVYRDIIQVLKQEANSQPRKFRGRKKKGLRYR